jgi:hypothetical protein
MRLRTGDEIEVAYGPAFGAEKLQLIEMDEVMLQETLKSG